MTLRWGTVPLSRLILRRAAAKVAEAQRSQVEVLPTGHVGELVLVVEDEAAVRRHTVEALRESLCLR